MPGLSVFARASNGRQILTPDHTGIEEAPLSAPGVGGRAVSFDDELYYGTEEQRAQNRLVKIDFRRALKQKYGSTLVNSVRETLNLHPKWYRTTEPIAGSLMKRYIKKADDERDELIRKTQMRLERALRCPTSHKSVLDEPFRKYLSHNQLGLHPADNDHPLFRQRLRNKVYCHEDYGREKMKHAPFEEWADHAIVEVARESRQRDRYNFILIQNLLPWELGRYIFRLISTLPLAR